MSRFLSWLFRGRRLLPFLPLLSVACQSRRPALPTLPAYQTDRFVLSATPGTADGYPSTIDEGRFITSTGGSFPIPYGHFLKKGWGGTAIGWAVGSDRNSVPDSLEIRWFSYTEDKFYQGHFALPQQHIHALLQRGFWYPSIQKQETYGTLDVSVVPGGVVVVWLSAGRLQKVLIDRYQATAIDYSYERHRPRVDRAADVRETRAALAPEVQREIVAGTISSRKWDEYLRPYPWQLAFSQPLTLYKYSINYLNAETTSCPPTPDMAAYARVVQTPTPKPVPAWAMLYVQNAAGRKRLLRIDSFGEAEVQAAFQRLAARHPAQHLTLYVDLANDLNSARFSLRAAGEIAPLPKAQATFFDPGE